MDQSRHTTARDQLKTETPKELHSIIDDLWEKLPPEQFLLLGKRNGAAELCQKLANVFGPSDLIIRDSSGSVGQRAWELVGLFYKNQGRFQEAIPIFYALYDQILAEEERTGEFYHKGMPLVWISDCYSALGCRMLAKRYLMLTLVEDAIGEEGVISPEKGGIYFRLVWLHGLPDADLKKYATEIFQRYQEHPNESIYPEYLLQDLDQRWIQELPTSEEILVYRANIRYIRYLIGRLGEPTGQVLERLADYILSCMPGCRTARRLRSRSTDYDVVCSMEGLDLDFRSELGRYFVCECKDWIKPADFSTVSKFCRVLDSTKSRFGIVFSKDGLTGKGKATDAEAEQIRIFQERGIVVVSFDQTDLDYVAEGGNFITLLRTKYEKVRLDLRETKTQRKKQRTGKRPRSRGSHQESD
jgi:hypothetical protein